eukprot:scaffold2252_cov255-Pinguiococcus_pyrenoidosus.AAC.7
MDGQYLGPTPPPPPPSYCGRYWLASQTSLCVASEVSVRVHVMSSFFANCGSDIPSPSARKLKGTGGVSDGCSPALWQ